MGTSIDTFLPAPMAAEYRQHIDRVLNTGEMRQGEYQLQAPTGETRHFESRFVRYAPNEVLVLVRDITDRALADVAVRESEARFRTIFEQVADVIFMISLEGVILALNPGFKTLLGYEREDWLGKPFAPLVHPEDMARANQAIHLTLRRMAPSTLNVRILAANGQYRMFEFRARPLSDAGRMVGILGVGRDVTNQREAEEQRLAFALERERIAFLRRFITGFSHDIRTSLAMISTGAYLAQRKLSDEARLRAADHFAQLETEVRRLEEQLENLLTIANLEREMSEARFTAVPVARVAQAAVERQQAQAKALGHTLTWTADTNDALVLGDETELTRAVTHLVVNALRYTPPGGEVKVRLQQTDADVVITIRDNGIGISPENLSRIFEPFFRADPARNLDTGGMGLGLSLAKLIVEGQGGRIDVVSELGQGSTFTIKLPLYIGEAVSL